MNTLSPKTPVRPLRSLCMLLLAAGLAVGCSKEGTDSGASGLPPDAGTASMPPPSPRAPRAMPTAATNATVIADTGNVNATLERLTQELRDYVVRTRSVPKNFEEFAAKSQMRFPPAPDGKQYAIKGQAVVLVER